MASKLISIISYLPEDEFVRKARFSKLVTLCNRCNELFNLPIYIVIQNYRDEEIQQLIMMDNVTISKNYEKLGILGARKRLREDILLKHYDYYIFLDDDSTLEGTKEAAKKYLKTINEYKDGWGNFKNLMLKLFVCSYNLLKQVEFYDVNPEEQEAFEDTLFIQRLIKYFPKNKIYFDYNIDLRDTARGVGDPLSTWYTKETDVKSMLKRTETLKERI